MSTLLRGFSLAFPSAPLLQSLHPCQVSKISDPQHVTSTSPLIPDSGVETTLSQAVVMHSLYLTSRLAQTMRAGPGGR